MAGSETPTRAECQRRKRVRRRAEPEVVREYQYDVRRCAAALLVLLTRGRRRGLATGAEGVPAMTVAQNE